MPTTNPTCMKTGTHPDPSENRPPHLSYGAFCLEPRDQRTWFLALIAAFKNAHCLCPAKQRRALLESNPPRDNWIDGDEIKSVSTFGEANTSPNDKWQTFISEPEHALKNSSKTVSRSSKHFRVAQHQRKTLRTNHLNWYPFFRSKRRRAGRGLSGNMWDYAGLRGTASANGGEPRRE